MPSRADESSNWGADRRTSSHNYEPRSRGNSQGRNDDRDYQPPRSDGDHWSKDNRFQPSRFNDRSKGRYGFHYGGAQPHSQQKEDRWGQRSVPTPPPSDSSSQGRRPLMLSKRTKPLPEQGAAPEIAPPVRSRNNPFGDAKPREENLKERMTSSDMYSSKYVLKTFQKILHVVADRILRATKISDLNLDLPEAAFEDLLFQEWNLAAK